MTRSCCWLAKSQSVRCMRDRIITLEPLSLMTTKFKCCWNRTVISSRLQKWHYINAITCSMELAHRKVIRHKCIYVYINSTRAFPVLTSLLHILMENYVFMLLHTHIFAKKQLKRLPVFLLHMQPYWCLELDWWLVTSENISVHSSLCVLKRLKNISFSCVRWGDYGVKTSCSDSAESHDGLHAGPWGIIACCVSQWRHRKGDRAVVC